MATMQIVKKCHSKETIIQDEDLNKLLVAWLSGPKCGLINIKKDLFKENNTLKQGIIEVKRRQPIAKHKQKIG